MRLSVAHKAPAPGPGVVQMSQFADVRHGIHGVMSQKMSKLRCHCERRRQSPARVAKHRKVEK